MTSPRELAVQHYRRFAGCDGNQHIASEFALEQLLLVVRRWRPRDVLEIGLGIGSISYSVMSGYRLHGQGVRYCGTERNPFCLSELRRNLGELFPKLEVFPDVTSIPAARRFDLVIVDGQDPALSRLGALVKKRAIIFVEGDRRDQFTLLRDVFPNSLAYRTVSLRRNPRYGPISADHWSSGCHVAFVDPDMPQTLSYLMNRMSSSLKYRVRRFFRDRT